MKAKDFRWGIDKLSDIEPEPSSYYFPEYAPFMQLHVLNQLVEVLLEKSSANSTDIQVGKHTGLYSGERGGDAYADDCATSAYFDAFMSSSIAAALAQFLESLIKNETLTIKKNEGENAKDSNHVRTLKMTKAKHFWDVGKYWCDQSNRIETGIVGGSLQLCEALNLSHKLPINFATYMKVLFGYRNYVMHNGVEWEKTRRDKFKETIQSTGCEGFYWSKSDGEDNVCYLKDAFIKELLTFCNDLYHSFYPDHI